ncbi:MAG: RNA-processing protein [Candidatus Diapherotrites archaeon]|uniref:RNA-processing protein n=1 Tax=Candidatus Iainarchaeum sp. TaxID=3101447 RepID=A0A938YWD9_9ARCH|nr:RNA-processing protein [Candidatus Diapherotrites archaeon]
MPYELFETVKMPKSRVAVLIGSRGKTKRKLEELSSVKIGVDSETGDVEVEGKGNAENFYSAVNAVKAIGRGFSPENAMLLIGGDCLLEVIKVSDVIGGGQADQKAKKGRVIGRQGTARETIERETGSKISVMGKTISIIAGPESMETTRRAVEMLLRGANHSTIFKFLEKEKAQGRKFSI